MIDQDTIDELEGTWRKRLLVTPTFTPKPIVANALIALRNALEWQGVLAYDEFTLATMIIRPPPWKHGTNGSWEPTRWTDREDVLAAEWLQHMKICVPVHIAAQAVEAVAKDASFHPIKDYLDGLQWDGVGRIEKFAPTYLGAEDTPYHVRSAAAC
jgi:predicted P-loop ATPase